MPEISHVEQNYKYDFFSGANIGIFMANTRITEAVGIEFNLSQTKRPIYGWASSLWDGVADGIVQCQGSIYINFRQAHMMTALVDNAQGVTDTIPSFTQSPADPTYIAGLTDSQIKELEDQYWSENPNTKTYSPSRRPDEHPKGFRIWITYGDFFGNNGANTLRTLHGVHIIGYGQTIEYNGNPILEAYNFIARQVT